MSAHLLSIFLFCFAQMETGNGVPYKPGAHRERGQWQLTPGVRADRERDLRAQGVKNYTADMIVAGAHVLWIRQRLIANGCANPTPFDIAVAWNAGVKAKVTGKAPNASYDYAARFSALVQDELDREKR